jgi:hypothetical protein
MCIRAYITNTSLLNDSLLRRYVNPGSNHMYHFLNRRHMQLANFQARVMVSGIDRRLRYGQLMILRYLAPFIIYFVRTPVFEPVSQDFDRVVLFVVVIM